jgi:hypothetical protein
VLTERVDSQLSTGSVDNLRTRVDDTRGAVHDAWNQLWTERLILGGHPA